MALIDTAIEFGLPAASLAVWAAVFGALVLRTRPTPAAPMPATMDLPGAEPPAVVSLLVNHWQITVDAAESTLLDLAARGFLELRQAGGDPRHTTVHIRNKDLRELNPYERQVFDRVSERAVHGVVPLTALGFSDTGQATAWSRRLRDAVIADARARGLSRRRFSPAHLTVLSVLAGVAACGVTVGFAHHQRHESIDDLIGQSIGAFVVVIGILSGIAGRVKGERDTPAGRVVAARWLGLRAWLAGHESFADLPPAAVSVWDRYLPYGAALGVTRLASQIIDLDMADRTRIWSSYTGGWRRVTVSYPRSLPRYGQRLGWIVFRAALAAMLGWTFADPRSLWDRLFDADVVTMSFTLVGLALLGYAGYTLVRVLLDLTSPVTVSGEVLWHQLWRTRQVGDEDNRRTVPVSYYLVIDDGRAEHTRAWILPVGIADGCRVGDVISIRVRPWTRRVLQVDAERRPHVQQGELKGS